MRKPLITLFLLSALTVSLLGAADRPLPADSCARDAQFPLRVILEEDPSGRVIHANDGLAVRYEIVSDRVFDRVRVELVPSPGVRLRAVGGNTSPAYFGPLTPSAPHEGGLSAVLDRSAARGTVEVRAVGWKDGFPIQTSAVWNLLSEELIRDSQPRLSRNDQGEPIVEHKARRISP